MANIASGIMGDSNIMNLKSIDKSKLRSEVFDLLLPGEEIILSFMTIRDQVAFTNKRIFVVNVQGITGKKVAYFSYPYSKIQYYGIETAGLLDIDCELKISFSDGLCLQLDFKSSVDMKKINALISGYIL